MRGLMRALLTAAALLALLGTIYLAHYFVFRDSHHIFIYLLGDVAFLPLEVLLVTVVLERLLTAREKSRRQQKANLLRGAFFSTVGYELLRALAAADRRVADLVSAVFFHPARKPGDFVQAHRRISMHAPEIDSGPATLEELRKLLVRRRDRPHATGKRQPAGE